MITQATIFDIDDLVPIFDAYRGFYGKCSDLIRSRQFLVDRFCNFDSIIFLAKSDAGKAIGFVQLYPSFSSVNMQRIWILNDLFVDPSHRNSRVGERLIDKAIEYGRLTEAKKLVLQTGVSNSIAQRLYSRLGWEKEDNFITYYLNLT